MKKFASVFLLGCIICSALIVHSFAVDVTAGDRQSSLEKAEQYAYLDIGKASPEMQKMILDARNAIIFSSEWVADGYTGCIRNVQTGEVLRELPAFSTVFPDWEMPILDSLKTSEHKVTLSPPFQEAADLIPTSLDSWLRIGNFRHFIEAATIENAAPFTAFTVDPYSAGTSVEVYATELTSSRNCNIGVSDPLTGASYALGENLKEFDSVHVDGLWYSDIAIRASTYDSTGWGRFAVDAAYRAGELRSAD